MANKQIEVTATVRVISVAKKKPLTETENFNCKVSLAPGVDYPKDVLKQVVEVDVNDKFTEVFLERIKRTPSLKNSIGGTKWQVEVSSVQY